MDKNESLVFLDRVANEMGKSELLEALARSMNSNYLKNRLEFIVRCYDLNLNGKSAKNESL